MMGERGKEVPKQHARHKRAFEGLLEIPPDLFSKRPLYEMTTCASTDVERQSKRRMKNKEAAEKSRKKKKEEFTNLQTDNDQLQQDKCHLVSMIEKLKTDLHKVTKENTALRCNTDHLKRWIGKHANDLGLGKHLQNGQAEEVRLVKAVDGSADTVLQGDPSLHSAGPAEEEDQQLCGSVSPVSFSGPTISPSFAGTAVPCPSPSSTFQASAPPTFLQAASKCPSPQLPSQEFFQSVGIRTVASLPQRPLAPSVKQAQEASLWSETGQQEQAMSAAGQHFVYLQNETVLIAEGEEGRQVILVAQGEPHTMLGAQEVYQITAAIPNAQQINVRALEEQGAWLEGSEVQEIQAEAGEVHEANVHVEPIEEQEASMEAIEVQEARVEAIEEQEEQEANMEAIEVQEEQKGSVEAIEEQEASVEAIQEQEGQEASVESIEEQEGQEASVEAIEEQEEQKASVETIEEQEEQEASVETAEKQMVSEETAGEQKASAEAPGTHKETVEVQEAQEEIVEAPEPQEESVEVAQVPWASKEVSQMPAAPDDDISIEARHGDMSENHAAAKETTDTIKDTESVISDVSSVHKSALAHYVEVLLKMGYKIQPPEEALPLPDVEGKTTLKESTDH